MKKEAMKQAMPDEMNEMIAVMRISEIENSMEGIAFLTREKQRSRTLADARGRRPPGFDAKR
ncbi:hypothetical protein [Caballeronia ptereochthonis]|uniref:hypothetical protein n=1 Tax=Caballeronia ptereochthonis TaxID=1777144 RepID=UPI000B17B3E5|nr:hypothetical protein [Caballeronia ptereochthonis]